jgi:hypothetical protein
MTLLLYAVIPVSARVPDGFRALHGNRAAVLYAEQDGRPATDREAVIAFGRAVERIALDGPALPMRFGAAVADLEGLRLLIAENEEAWAARLDAVAGCCELIVHLVHPPSAEPRVGGLDHPAGSVEAHDAVRDGLRAVLNPWLREARSLTVAESDRIAVLVPVAQAAHVRTRIEQWAADHAGLEIEITGPWPPFSFCDPAA